MLPSGEPAPKQTEAPSEGMEEATPSKWHQKRSGWRPILTLDKMIQDKKRYQDTKMNIL